MKTAVSLPDPVFEAGERLAQRLGISRSQLYSKALREYVERHDDDEITRRLNEVYATESSEPDPVVSRIAALSDLPDPADSSPAGTRPGARYPVKGLQPQ